MNDKLKSKNVLRIDELLHKKGISKTDFAKKLGVNRQTLYSFMNRNITLETILKIAEMLDVQVWELFSSSDIPAPGEVLDGIVIFQDKHYRIKTVDDLQELLKMVQGSTQNDTDHE